MWADSLLALERGHLFRLALWGGTSVATGLLLLLWLRWRKADAPLLTHFGIQTLAWGAVDLAICAWSRGGLVLRDFAGAQQLLQTLWLNIGLDAGYAGVGITIAVAAWRWGARTGGIGAGVAIVIQGIALFLLDLRLVTLIGPVG